MTWAHPRHTFKDDNVIDLEELNEQFQYYARTAGDLNESNFAADSLENALQQGKVADDVCMRLFGNTRNGILGKGDPYTAVTDVPQTVGWDAIPGTTLTWDSRGGKHLIMSSFQMILQPSTTTFEQTGAMFCHEVDASPRPESLIGSGDLSSDVKTKPRRRQSPNTGIIGTPNASFVGAGPAVRGLHRGLVLTTLVDLPPGRHICRIAIKNLAIGFTNIQQKVSTANTFILEMWA